MSLNRAAALLRLFDETAALFHRLRAVAEDLHGHNVPSAGRRAILQSLSRQGPQTVPQLARARPVSRQHIQVLVNGLLEHALVETDENPAHRRSPLLRLTDKGKRHLRAMQDREMELLARARPGLTAKQIDSATDTLRSLRRFLESSDWRQQVAADR